MSDTRNKTILAECPAEDFVGRSAELDRLLACAKNPGSGPLTVMAAPGMGVTELLKQAYDRLFREHSPVIPFYFALRRSDRTAQAAAQRFLHEFMVQTVAFRRQDESLLGWYPNFCELAELAIPADGHWIDRLIEACSRDRSAGNDDTTILRTALGAPLRAAASGAKVFLMIDDCQTAAYSEHAAAVFDVVKNVFRGGPVSYVLAGRRRFGFDEQSGERLVLEPLSFAEASRVVEKNSARFGVKINDETRDLIANQFDGSAAFVRFLFQAAAEKNDHLESFLNVQKIYAQEIFGGRIQQYYAGVIKDIAPTEELAKGILSLLDVSMTLGKGQLSVESWLKRLAIGERALSKTLELLNIEELIRLTGNRVEPMDASEVLSDYISSRFRLEVTGENRAALYGQCVATFLKRAPQLMARFYRRTASLGLRDLLASFALQEVPAAILDYGLFADRYKGLTDSDASAGLRADPTEVMLPQIVYTANASDLYKPIEELTEKERSVVAIGFEEGRYIEDDEIVWIAAEVDSKLEASRELAEFWCDRLEMVGLMCNFSNYRIWVITPEGFTAEAMETLRQRSAYGSCRRQVELLMQFLADQPDESHAVIDEYEVTVPMHGDSELIAAHTLEEIARRHNFPSKAINQLKTALLEASINAAEHSLSPDRRIHQKFSVEDDRIVITVSNRGLRLTDKKAVAEDDAESGSERRGWGLKLIAKLMDEVKILQTDDGTSISMTKYLQKEVLA